eukprot:scaffold357346_cov39-Prasinocladus_malaysianus.AAC.1
MGCNAGGGPGAVAPADGHPAACEAFQGGQLAHVRHLSGALGDCQQVAIRVDYLGVVPYSQAPVHHRGQHVRGVVPEDRVHHGAQLDQGEGGPPAGGGDVHVTVAVEDDQAALRQCCRLVEPHLYDLQVVLEGLTGWAPSLGLEQPDGSAVRPVNYGQGVVAEGHHGLVQELSLQALVPGAGHLPALVSVNPQAAGIGHQEDPLGQNKQAGWLGNVKTVRGVPVVSGVY